MGGFAVELAGVAVFVALLLAAAVSDLRSFHIPNAIPIALATVVGVLAILGHAAVPWQSALAAGATAFIAGFALFAVGIWGGGDAKLLAAASLWTGFAAMPRFLAVMVLAGGVVAAAVLVRRRLGGPSAAAGVPYGIAIAAAGLDWSIARLSMLIG